MPNDDDVLDPARAAEFAWRTALADQAPTTPADAPAAPADAPAPDVFLAHARAVSAAVNEAAADPEKARDELAHARARCAELAANVLHAWALGEGEAQAAATRRLAEGLAALGMWAVGMRFHPLEAVRLARLVVRYVDRLGREAREAALFGLAWGRIEHEEVVELLVEAARCGDPDVAYAMDRCTVDEDDGRLPPRLGPALAGVLEAAPRWRSRALAARWLSAVRSPEVTPPLRRALRAPHTGVRLAALEALLERRAIEAEDVQFLLDDAVVHPISARIRRRGDDDLRFRYPNALVRATRLTRPPDGARPLEILARGDGAIIDGDAGALDEEFAWRALAAAYPDRALGFIDEALAVHDHWTRHSGLEAAAELPDELARPRLAAAAADPAFEVNDRAKQLFAKRFGEELVVEPTTGVPMEVLGGAAPSARFFERLAILRGKSHEAREAIAEVMLAEAPAREPLALLAFALRDYGLWVGRERASLPSRLEGWVDALLERFGTAAADALLIIARPPALAGGMQQLLWTLGSAARDTWPEASRSALVALAAEALLSPGAGGLRDPVSVLSTLPAPAACIPRLWAIAVDGDLTGAERRSDWARYGIVRDAATALARVEPNEGLDRDLAREAERALADADFARLDRLLAVLFERAPSQGAVLDLAERALDVALARGSEAANEVASACVDALAAADRLDEARRLAWLEDPSSPRFDLAAARTRDPSGAELDCLRRALDSTARSGAPRAVAACELLWSGAMGPLDPRLGAILASAPPRTRACLVGILLRAEAPLGVWREAALELLCGDDASAASDAFESLDAHEPEGATELLREARARGPNPGVRESLDDALGEPSEAESYWQKDEDEGVDEAEVNRGSCSGRA
jgi:hypothetical protein